MVAVSIDLTSVINVMVSCSDGLDTAKEAVVSIPVGITLRVVKTSGS